MKLTVKFNLILISIILICLLGTGFFTHFILHRNAKNEVLKHASLILDMAHAVRGYTVEEVRPIIQNKMIHKFHPQSVPAYAASKSFDRLSDKHPKYSYKEAALNPTNPKNLAADWEIDIINSFANDASRSQIIDMRNTANGPSLFISQPIRLSNPDCLTCHSEPSKAPKAMLAKYGKTNGFGWKMNDVVAAQIVTVPMSIPTQVANQIFIIIMAFILAIFAFLIIVINLMLKSIVIKPMNKIAVMAGKVSMGQMDTPELNFKSKDEITVLASSFNRMRRSLQKAIKMLED